MSNSDYSYSNENFNKQQCCSRQCLVGVQCLKGLKKAVADGNFHRPISESVLLMPILKLMPGVKVKKESHKDSR